MSGDREHEVQSLIDRIANGESVDIDAIPEALRDTPEVQRLLAIMRVTQVLDRNFGAATPVATCDTVIGPWRLAHLLGSGGMGEVWLGERSDGVVEHRVAIKRVRSHGQRFHERLLSERRLLARLEHPNIARFIDAGVDGSGAPWLAMEYVEGMPITQWCAEHALSVRARLQLFQKVCAAIEHAHRHLIVHRDLKPSNVMVNIEGEPKLLDFGIAKLLDDGDGVTTVGALTPAYAAPEQLRGEEISTATDVYVLGLLLYRILAGALPETRSSGQLAGVLARINEEETQRPSSSARTMSDDLPYPAHSLSGDLDAIVAQAIRAHPRARYGSAGELSADIERYLQARPVRARTPSRRYLLSRFIRRNYAATGLGALALLALVAGTVVSLQQAHRAEREASAAHRELARAERVSEFLGSLYREQDPLRRDAMSARAPEVLVAEAVARVKVELSDAPRSQAQLLRVLGEAQLNLSQLDAAHRTLDLAADRVAANAHGGGTEALLNAEIDALRGAVAQRELRNDEAKHYFSAALRQASAVAGEDSAVVGRINALAASTLLGLSQFKEAREVAMRAYDLLNKRLGSNHPETISAAVALGVVQEQLREDASAMVTLRTSIALIEQRFGVDNARLVQPLRSLGEVSRRARDFVAGRAALKRGASIAQRQLGERHVLLAEIMIARGRLEGEAGDIGAAMAALAEAEHALPDDEVNTRAQLLAYRGQMWVEHKEGRRAEADLRGALAIYRTNGGLQSGIAWYAQAQLAWALALQDRFDEAQALLAEAAQHMQALLGPDAYQNALISVRRAIAFELQGDWRNAAKFYRESVAIEERFFGRENFLHFTWSLGLGQALSKLDDGRDDATHIIDALIAQWGETPEAAGEYAQMILLRCELYSAAGETDAARHLAWAALNRPQLVATAEQRVALEQFAVPR